MVKASEQPMKMVKVRAGTVNKMRELEVLKDELRVAGQDGEGQSSSSSGGADIMQGLYAFSQTEPYIPDPVVNVSCRCWKASFSFLHQTLAYIANVNLLRLDVFLS